VLLDLAHEQDVFPDGVAPVPFSAGQDAVLSSGLVLCDQLSFGYLLLDLRLQSKYPGFCQRQHTECGRTHHI
jgi:hypothetical protein